jgi:hypothetical protein
MLAADDFAPLSVAVLDMQNGRVNYARQSYVLLPPMLYTNECALMPMSDDARHVGPLLRPHRGRGGSRVPAIPVTPGIEASRSTIPTPIQEEPHG